MRQTHDSLPFPPRGASKTRGFFIGGRTFRFPLFDDYLRDWGLVPALEDERSAQVAKNCGDYRDDRDGKDGADDTVESRRGQGGEENP